MAYLNPLSVYTENYEQNGTAQPGSEGTVGRRFEGDRPISPSVMR